MLAINKSLVCQLFLYKKQFVICCHLVGSFVIWPCLCRALTTHVVGDHHRTVPITLCSVGDHHWTVRTARDRQRSESRFREQQMRAGEEWSFVTIGTRSAGWDIKFRVRMKTWSIDSYQWYSTIHNTAVNLRVGKREQALHKCIYPQA